MKFQVSAISLACAMLLAGCGGGGGDEGGGAVQSISFPFPGGPMVAIPPDVATLALKATASSGGPVIYTSNTPTVCTVSGSTVSLLIAGECSVTASQAGFEDYAPTSQSQLFVIPKRPQLVVFRNPGALALDTQSVALVATSSLGLPVSFASSTPAVCSVSGTSLVKHADGICTITASQEGSNIFEAAKMVKNIPIGTALAPALTFLSGYKSTSATNEGGTVGVAGGSNLNGWWCNGWCDTTISEDGSTLSNTFNFKMAVPTDGSWWTQWSQIEVYAPGLAKVSETNDTSVGVRIDAQAALKFTLAQNTEWFSTGDSKVNVDLTLGHFNFNPNDSNKPCNVTLRGTITPSAAAATSYSIRLKDLTVDQTCGLKDLNAWNELQDYSIAKIKFGSVNANSKVSSVPAPNYQTRITLTGPVTFQ